jgi:dihydrofolate synthase / folylpolyglutamate synthase
MRLWRVPYPKFGKGPGLERVALIADRLGVDFAGFGKQGAVIVGSNGKGSTAAMTAALMQQTGANVGLFTSPHLFALNERFRIGGKDISDDELAEHWERVSAAVEVCGKTDELGGFEFLFLVAADWFAARECTHTVWEAGIGGRLDPVRLIEAQRVALTSLDLEHTELLGETLEEIARDKINAAPPGAILFVGEGCLPIADAIAAYCEERGVVPVFSARSALGSATPSLEGQHQRSNAVLALSLARDLVPDLSDQHVSAGFAATRWPGRLEVIDEDPLTIIDVGHTPDGIRRALSGFNEMRGEREAVLVCGASHDKNTAAIVGALAPSFSTIVCATARHKGALSAEIAGQATAANPQAEIVAADSVAEARVIARAKASAAGAIYVAGGLFLAAEFKWVHLGRDPAFLAFF